MEYTQIKTRSNPVNEIPRTYWLILTIAGYLFITLLLVVQPVALVYLENKFSKVPLDTMGTITLIMIFLLGCLSLPTLGLNLLYFKDNKAANYDMKPQLIIAIIYAAIGLPTFVFIFIEMSTHPSMIHTHIDVIETIIVAADFVFGFLGQGLIIGSHIYPKK